MTFFFQKTCFVHFRSGTYYALLLGCFGLKHLADVRHCVYWVLVEIWALDSSHQTGNILFIVRPGGKVRLCVKLFDFYRGWILIRLTWNFSRFVPNSVEILTWNFGENYFGRIFQKFCANQGNPLPKPVSEYSSIWLEIFRVLSRMQWRFFYGNSGKKYFGRIF